MAEDLTLKLRDDTGRVLVGAQGTITFVDITSRENPHEGPTNEQGKFRASIGMSIAIFLQASMPGYYPALVRSSNYYDMPIGEAMVPVVLPRVLQPTALHALRASIIFPVQDHWLGYDLQAADFVPPHGKGKTADIRFKYGREFLGWKMNEEKMASARQVNREKTADEIRFFYGKWRGALEVSFPGEKEGVITEAERYLFYGQLRLPHLAT